MREVPRYLLEGPWADYVDYDTLALKLNERDIDYHMEAGSTELHFTNPGKSRAVIDVTYCLLPSAPVDPNEDDSDEGTDSGHDTAAGGNDGSSGGNDSSGGSDDGSNGSDGGDGSSDDDNDDSGVGIVVVDDPCPATVCGDVGL